MPSYEPVTAVLRGFDVLRAVSRLKRAAVGDIHKVTGLNRPTVVRMLETLEYAGFIFRHPDAPLYSVTGKTLELSEGYDPGGRLAAVSQPLLEALQRRIGWPSDVGVRDGDAMTVAATSRGEGRLFYNRRPGYRAPLLATSLGRAWLAFADVAEREQCLALLRDAPEVWNEPACNAASCGRLLAKVRRQGYATIHPDYAEREYRGAVSTLGVPILVEGRVVAALNAMFLRDTLAPAEAVEKLLGPLQETAALIAAALGSTDGKHVG